MYQSGDSDYCDITGDLITGKELARADDCPLLYPLIIVDDDTELQILIQSLKEKVIW
jgi:hypothetical protein